MYIWVILATFMLALYSFNLSYRSDIREIELEPLARSLISKVLIKQQASGEYLKAHTPPYAKITGEDGLPVTSDSVTYSPGVLSTEQLSPAGGGSFLPYGFVDDENVITEIYCIDEAGTNSLACSDENSWVYLMTYTVLPQKWLSIKTGVPSNDFLNAMKDMVGDDPGFGYPICLKYIEGDSEEKKCEQLGLRSRTGTYKIGYDEDDNPIISESLAFEIPRYIANNGTFAETCNDSSNNDMCLVSIYKLNIKKYTE